MINRALNHVNPVKKLTYGDSMSNYLDEQLQAEKEYWLQKLQQHDEY